MGNPTFEVYSEGNHRDETCTACEVIRLCEVSKPLCPLKLRGGLCPAVKR